MKEENYLSLVKLLPDIFYKIDQDGVFTYISDSVSILGYNIDELIGKHFTEIIHPDDMENAVRAFLVNRYNRGMLVSSPPSVVDERRTGERATRFLKIRLLRKGNFESNSIIPDSKVFYGEIFATGIYEQEENPAEEEFAGTVGIIRDVNSLQRSEEVIVRTEKHYRSLIENSTDIISIVASDGTILFESPSVKNILGYDEIELIGESLFDYIHEEDAALLANYFNQRLTENRVSASVEYRFKDRNNNFYNFETRGKTIFDERSELMCFVLNTRDITDRKKAEDIILKSLQEKESLLQELHHRVKNNFQIMLSLVNLQGSIIKEPEALNMIKDFETRIKSMYLIHERLYNSDNLAHIDCREYIESLIYEINEIYSAPHRQIMLEMDIPEYHFPVGKALPCSLLLNEIVSNSFKHAFPDEMEYTPLISISLKDNGGNYVLTVSDNGCGMPDDIMIDKSCSFGLTLIPLLVQQIGGTYEVINGKGTAYVIRFKSDSFIETTPSL